MLMSLPNVYWIMISPLLRAILDAFLKVLNHLHPGLGVEVKGNKDELVCVIQLNRCQSCYMLIAL